MDNLLENELLKRTHHLDKDCQAIIVVKRKRKWKREESVEK